MKRNFYVAFLLAGFFLEADAQIGYQVTVFDQVKMEPKANESVSAVVTISDNTGMQILSETHAGTTDEFGILSMTVGNTHSFDRANWENLPFWISASVDGITLSKTQILNVPVAEYAKKTGTLTSDILCSKSWSYGNSNENTTLSFRKDGSGTYQYIWYEMDGTRHIQSYSFNYNIDGDTVAWGSTSTDDSGVAVFIPRLGKLAFTYDGSKMLK